VQTKSKVKKNENWKLESGTLDNVGIIHINDINPTLKNIEKYIGIDLINNTIGSAGKRLFSGDIDIAIQLTKNFDIDNFVSLLSNIPDVVQVKKTNIVMIAVKIITDDLEKYTNYNFTGLVQIDFMFSENIDLLKLFYHSPYESDSKYKGLYRNILLGAISHYYDLVYSDENIIDNIPLYEERYFWSYNLGLYRGRKYRVLSKDKKNVLKKAINVVLDDFVYKTSDEIVKVLNLSSVDSLYSFEKLFEDINIRYNSHMVSMIIDEFVSNKNVIYYGIPDEIIKYKEVYYES
jgi:hypothetical protein